eukprot:scaffold318467_cov40-Tisochrysis_lutea.AAC.1
MINIKTGKTCRINLDVDSEEDNSGGQREGKRKKRTTTNSRPECIVRKVIGCLLSTTDTVTEGSCSAGNRGDGEPSEQRPQGQGKEEE